MPRVPTLDGRQVAQNQTPLNPFNQRPLDKSPIDAVERSRQAFSKTARGVLDSAVKIEQEEIKRANDMAVLAAESEISSLETQLLYEPGRGAMHQKGRNALGAVDAFNHDLTAGIEDARSRLANDQQRVLFDQKMKARLPLLQRRLGSHVGREITKFEAKAVNSFLSNERIAAIESFDNRKIIEQKVDNQRNAIFLYGEKYGIDKHTIQKMIENAESKTHKGVIIRWVDGDNYTEARKYYKDFGDQIIGEDKDKINRLLEVSKVRSRAEDLSLKIREKHKGYLKGMLEEAYKIENPVDRKETTRQIKARARYDKKIEKADASERMRRAFEILNASDEGDDIEDALPISLRDDSTAEEIEGYRKILSPPDTSDAKRLQKFTALATGSPHKLDDMSIEEFKVKYWAHFNAGDRESSLETFQNVKERFKNNKFTNALSVKKRIENALKGSGIIKDKAKLGAVDRATLDKAQLAVAENISEFERNMLGGKRKASPDEIQKIVDEYAIKAWRDDTFSLDDAVPLGAITREQLREDDFYIEVKNIPTEDRNKIEVAIQRSGKTVTDKLIGRLYVAMKKNDAEYIDELLQGE